MIPMFYAGIGSRETPPTVIQRMRGIAQVMAIAGYTLRSGCAEGADTAFEEGARSVDGKLDLYIPWKGFNGVFDAHCEPTPEAMKLAAQFHPAWDRCSQGARKLHARNVHQILGADVLNPILVEKVICWTVGGQGGGGTGQALRIARHFGVAIEDLGGVR